MSSRIDCPIYRKFAPAVFAPKSAYFLQGIFQAKRTSTGTSPLFWLGHSCRHHTCAILQSMQIFQFHVQTMKIHFALHITTFSIFLWSILLFRDNCSGNYAFRSVLTFNLCGRGIKQFTLKLPNGGPKNGPQANPSSPMLHLCFFIASQFSKVLFVFSTKFYLLTCLGSIFMLSIAYSASDLKQSFLASKMSSNSLVFIGEFVVNGKSYLADP